MKCWRCEQIADTHAFRRETIESLARIEAVLRDVQKKLRALGSDPKALVALTGKLDAAGNELAASVEAATPQS